MSPTLRARLQPSLLSSFLATTAVLAMLAPATATATAGVPGGWDEAVNGDLSNDGLAPSFVTLTEGSNLLRGSTGRSVDTGLVDLDYLTITVPAGFELTSMLVLDGTASIGFGSFIALVSGNTFPISPETGTADGMLGWTLYDAGNVGGDLLLFMSAPSQGSSGYTPPLQAGDYSFWIQETSTGVATYSFDMNLAAIPEPATALSLLAGLALLAAARRRR
jgi:hypothetical protein